MRVLYSECQGDDTSQSKHKHPPRGQACRQTGTLPKSFDTTTRVLQFDLQLGNEPWGRDSPATKPNNLTRACALLDLLLYGVRKLLDLISFADNIQREHVFVCLINLGLQRNGHDEKLRALVGYLALP